MTAPIAYLDRGPRRVAAQTVVNASPEELYALLSDPRRHHELDGSGSVKPEVIGPRELLVGDRFRVSMKRGPLPYAITSRVIAAEPGRAIEWQHPGKHTWRWEFEAQPEGGTKVTEIFDYTRSPIAAVLERAGMVEQNKASIVSSLNKLQSRFA